MRALLASRLDNSVTCERGAIRPLKAKQVERDAAGGAHAHPEQRRNSHEVPCMLSFSGCLAFKFGHDGVRGFRHRDNGQGALCIP